MLAKNAAARVRPCVSISQQRAQSVLTACGTAAPRQPGRATCQAAAAGSWSAPASGRAAGSRKAVQPKPLAPSSNSIQQMRHAQEVAREPAPLPCAACDYWPRPARPPAPGPHPGPHLQALHHHRQLSLLGALDAAAHAHDVARIHQVLQGCEGVGALRRLHRGALNVQLRGRRWVRMSITSKEAWGIRPAGS